MGFKDDGSDELGRFEIVRNEFDSDLNGKVVKKSSLQTPCTMRHSYLATQVRCSAIVLIVC